METKAIIPVEGGVFSFGVSDVCVTVETTELSLSLESVVSVTSVTPVWESVELSEMGKLVSVSVNDSESVTVSDWVPLSVSVLVEVFFDEVFVEVLVLMEVLVLVEVGSSVVSVLVDVEVLVGVSVSVVGGVLTVEVEDDAPPPSVDWVFRVTVKGEGAEYSTGVLSNKINFVTETEILVVNAEESTTLNGIVITTPDAVILETPPPAIVTDPELFPVLLGAENSIGLDAGISGSAFN